MIDPKTGIALTPMEVREREIDQNDPLKNGTPAQGKAAVPDDPRLTDRETPKPQTPQAPASGSGASSGNSLGLSQSATANQTSDTGGADEAYSGPGVLTRSYTLSRPMVMEQLKWQSTFGFNRSTDFGPAQGVVNAAGTIPDSTVSANSFTFGLNGRHLWKRDQLGLAYSGSYSNYSTTNLSGWNHSLNLNYSHILSRRMSFQVVESLTRLSQNYSLENPTLAAGSSIANINLSTSPEVQLLDNTVRQSSTTASLTYRQTGRLSYNASASLFYIERSGNGLTGMMGRQTQGDINYRLTKKTTIGVYYSYTNYRYSHDVSESNSHGAGVIYSYALNSRTQLRMRGGTTRIESLGYQSVFLPPQLAAILGQSSTVIDAYSSRWISDISGELVREFRRNRTATIAYARGVSPGNGLLLTSVQQTLTAGYAARLFRRFPANIGLTYSLLSSTDQSNIGHYKSETAYFSTSRQLRYGLAASVNLDYRRYDITGSPLLQHDTRVSVGFTWSPPQDKLRL